MNRLPSRHFARQIPEMLVFGVLLALSFQVAAPLAHELHYLFPLWNKLMIFIAVPLSLLVLFIVSARLYPPLLGVYFWLALCFSIALPLASWLYGQLPGWNKSLILLGALALVALLSGASLHFWIRRLEQSINKRRTK